MYKELLVKFMEKKQEIITETLGKKYKEFYFNNKDKEAIMQWGKDIAEQIYKLIYEEIFEYSEEGLSELLCPFCIYTALLDYTIKEYFKVQINYNCKKCQYYKNHNNLSCYNEESNFGILLDAIKRKTDDTRILNNKVYKEILKDIEKTYKLKK